MFAGACIVLDSLIYDEPIVPLGYRDGGGGVYGESRISAAAMVHCWGWLA